MSSGRILRQSLQLTNHFPKTGGGLLRCSQQLINPRTYSAIPDDEAHGGKKRLTEETMLQGLRKMEYEVRGRVVIAADEINSQLAKNAGDFPFDHIVYTNIGNPQGVGQKPLTWPRQVMALCDLSDEAGINHPNAKDVFPEDAIERAREIKSYFGGSGSGAYTHSQGAMGFRKDIAAFLEKRDGGVKAYPEHIYMTNGASKGIDMMLTALIANKNSGVMIPIPQYPLYSASIALHGGQQIDYYLDEEKGWGLNFDELKRALSEAREKGTDVNSFVLLNPGNPTGQVLTRKNVEDVCKFCAENNLVLLADEVYQENVYDENAEFVSCKRAAYDVGLLQDGTLELASFHSTSKGIYGECGRRGGYMELVGFDPKVEEHIYKKASSTLCPNVDGQIMCDLMVREPEPGNPSYESHEAEKKGIFESLKRRSKIVSEGLDSIPGFSCQTAHGSMYCFPKVDMPAKAIEAAKEQNMTPDTLYALSLLANTGICVVPASGFGQKPGRHGFRTTFLPSEEEMERAVDLFAKHHVKFCEKYA